MDNNLNFIVVWYLMLEALALSARTRPPRHEMSGWTIEPCVPAHWFQVGSYRSWQRRVCIKRRDEKATEPTTEPTTTDINDQMPSEERGPKRNASYNPNYGYEPYWPEGDWVFDDDPYVKDPMVYMCGLKCSRIYRDYGWVCGRDKDYNYKSFENYCALKNWDCSGLRKWKMIYRGKCFRKLVAYSNLYVPERVHNIMTRLVSLYTLKEGKDKFLKKNMGFEHIKY